MSAAPSEPVRTTCPYCGVGCGVLAEVKPEGAIAVRGDPEHPANFGRLCSKGSALGETVGLDGRLLAPTIHGRLAGWDEALDLVATTFSNTVAEHGPNSVAFYVSGQLLTEDYYVANKLMKGFIGSANIDTNSRLCMSSSVAGHKRAFGSDTVPGTYEDLELADLVVLVGSNLAWCHPVLYQRLAAAKQARPNMRVVVVDPRRTMTADIADLHLPVRADGDCGLFNGLFAWLATNGPLDRAYIDAHTTGFEAALAAAGASDLAATARSDAGFRPANFAPSTICSPRRSGPSPCTARASTSPHPAPTRSTPSSTAIWRRAASASPAWAPSRSPASRTRWAGARSAASPTCWPRIWTSRTPRTARGCRTSGARRA